MNGVHLKPMTKTHIIDVLTNTIRNCQTCYACELGDLNKVKVISQLPFRRNLKTKEPITGLIAFVGEAPGMSEYVVSEAFVGRSGKLLDKALHEVGLSPKDYFVTNAVLCTPFESDARDTIRTPTKFEYTTCSKKNLKELLEILKPRLIIALGKIAHISLSQLKVEHDLLAHPAFILRNGGEGSIDYARFILQLRNILNG